MYDSTKSFGTFYTLYITYAYEQQRFVQKKFQKVLAVSSKSLTFAFAIEGQPLFNKRLPVIRLRLRSIFDIFPLDKRKDVVQEQEKNEPLILIICQDVDTLQ